MATLSERMLQAGYKQNAGSLAAQMAAAGHKPITAAAPQPSAPANDLITDRGAVGNFIGNVAGAGKKLLGLFTGNEQAVGGEIAAGLPASVTGEDTLNKANQDLATADINFIKTIKQRQAAGVPLTKAQVEMYNHILATTSSVGTQTDLLPHAADTNAQAIGNVAGVAADILTPGNFAAKPAAQAAKQGVAQIAKQAVVRSAAGAATGYAYDIAGNAQNGKTGAAVFEPGVGTATGALAPLLIGGVRAGVAVSKQQAPRFINSLIKPKTADFAYGKDPGRTVSELGITGNNLSDFSKNISTAKNDIVGSQIGAIYDLPANQAVRINANPAISLIDDAMTEAAKGGKQNQAVVTQLSHIKDALLYEHGINDEGVITRTGDAARDLASLTPREAQDLIGHVADQTRFTGSPSDDKAVNSTLKRVYGAIREAITEKVAPNSPEIEQLNQQYADLTSAELAVRNRDKIVQRSNLVSLPSGGAAATGAIVTAIVTGGAAIPAILGGATAYTVEKAFESTAVKTRVAAWLAKEGPTAISTLLQKNPNLGPILNRVFPAIMSKLSH